MHRIVKAHLDSFVSGRGLEAEDEATQFEMFTNFSVISSISSASFDLDDVTTGLGDDGVDGIAIIIDEEVALSKEDVEAIPAIRIFSVHNAAKCVAAMYCDRPELAARYPKAMYAELTDKIFAEDTREVVFYAACLTIYRFSLLVSNSVIPQNMKRFKWHILPIVRALISGKGLDPLNSKKAEVSANKVIDMMVHHGAKTTDTFTRAVAICQSLGAVSPDKLKRQAILAEMLAKV